MLEPVPPGKPDNGSKHDRYCKPGQNFCPRLYLGKHGKALLVYEVI